MTYTIEDAAGARSTATVTLTITGITDAPPEVGDVKIVGSGGRGGVVELGGRTTVYAAIGDLTEPSAGIASVTMGESPLRTSTEPLVLQRCEGGTCDQPFFNYSATFTNDSPRSAVGDVTYTIRVEDNLGGVGTSSPQKAEIVIDSDGDGVKDSLDCNASDARVYPGAPDEPEIGYASNGTLVDQNCDGMDGTADEGTYLSPTGNDIRNNGLSKGSPKKTLKAAIDAAVATGRKGVFVSNGTYDTVAGGVTLADGVSIWGGYPKDFGLDRIWITAISGTGQALGGTGVKNLTIQNMQIKASVTTHVCATTTGCNNGSVYGLRLLGGSDVRVESSTIAAGDAARGIDALEALDAPGVGAKGEDGGYGEEDDAEAYGAGGKGATGGPGHDGGAGGRGESISGSGSVTKVHFAVDGSNGTGPYAGAGGMRGFGNLPCKRGGDGVAGKDASNAEIDGAMRGTPAPASGAVDMFANGGVGTGLTENWIVTTGRGTVGGLGQVGSGGGGGGGGKSQFNTSTFGCFPGAGAGGGGGGEGGEGGYGGRGGHSGNASVGIWLHDSKVTLYYSGVSSAKGGRGGDGGRGGIGAEGGAGGKGGLSNDDLGDAGDEVGFGGNGGKGGTGGYGGGGGGGTGGPSWGIARFGSSSVGGAASDYSVSGGTSGAGGTGYGGAADGRSFPQRDIL